MPSKSFRMPDDIAYGAVGGPEFSTSVVDVDSGFDQRWAHCSQPRNRYNVSWGIRTLDDLQRLSALWRVVGGRRHAFRFKDWVDYSTAPYSGRGLGVITPWDTSQADGDGVSYTFQLRKTYERDGYGAYRDIVKPVANTLRIALGAFTHGVDRYSRTWASPGEIGHFTVDPETGIVTLTVRHSITGNDLTFTPVNVQGQMDYCRVTSTTTDLSGFQQGEPVTLSGASDATMNTGETTSLYWFARETSTVNELRLASFGIENKSLAAGDEITIASYPPPLNGQKVYAGFEFDVACRFDIDHLPLVLEDYGIGSSQQISLIEVRGTN